MSSSRRKGGNNEIVGGITVTLLLIILYRIGTHVSLPFVNEKALMVFGERTFGRLSIFSLGIMPYVSAYILVEIGSLFIPFLKKLRRGYYKGRRRLKGWAYALAFFLAVFQSYGIVRSLTGMTSTNGTPILGITGIYDYAILIAILTGGVFFLICICELISKYGIGNGVSVIIFTGICARYGHNFVKTTKLFHEVGPGPYVLALVFAFVIALATVVLLKTKVNMSLRHKLSGESVTFFQLNTCPSGTVAIVYAVSLIMLPVTLSHFFGWGGRFIGILSSSGLGYNVLLAIFIFVFSYLFAYLFFHPKRRLDKMSERGWQFPESDHVKLNYLSRKLLVYNFPWTVLLCALAIIPHVLITQFNLPFYIGGSTMFLPIAISLDVLDRLNVLRKSKSGRLCKIAELHDVYDASMIIKHMQSEGIICHFQGYYHRHLLYFFGPYIDISVMVSERDRESGEELIRKYYNGFGLVSNR